MHPFLPIIAPGLFGFGSSMICNVGESSGEVVKFRPPSWLFSLAWPVLYLMMGLSWYYARQGKGDSNMIDLANFLLTMVLCLWIYVYSCNKDKKTACVILVVSIAVALMVYTIVPLTSKLFLCPLLAWLVFALIMNCVEVQETD